MNTDLNERLKQYQINYHVSRKKKINKKIKKLFLLYKDE